jgi:hypothetical protein
MPTIRRKRYLHNLLRGSGVRGAAAMPEAPGTDAAPVASVERSRLASYAEVNHLSWMMTKATPTFATHETFLRHESCPKMRVAFQAPQEQLAAAARVSARRDALLDELRPWIWAPAGRIPNAVDVIREAFGARAKNLLRAMLGLATFRRLMSVALTNLCGSCRYAGNRTGIRASTLALFVMV